VTALGGVDTKAECHNNSYPEGAPQQEASSV
jgi:hypothetical protein